MPRKKIVLNEKAKIIVPTEKPVFIDIYVQFISNYK